MYNTACLPAYLSEVGDYRIWCYQTVAEQFQIETALYPGSANDIAPSLFIPHVCYLDKALWVREWFQVHTDIGELVSDYKVFPEEVRAVFYGCDYNQPPELPQYDLLLSFYAGDVGQTMKPYLKVGGLLMVAEGPNDWIRAHLDKDYELLGTMALEEDGVVLKPGIRRPVRIPLPEELATSFLTEVEMQRIFLFRKTK